MSGLEGVVVADTELSMVDGANGELVVRGMPVRALAARARLEDAMALLWHGDLSRSEVLRAELGAARVRVREALGTWRHLPDAVATMRAALAPLEGATPVELVAAAGEVLVGWSATEAGRASLDPDPDAWHADDLVRRLNGEARPALARALGAYLCTVADHGMNASTFTARVVASTGSDDTSAVVAAIGALKGPLHGGAPGPVLDMLDAVGTPERAEAWVEAELAAGRRIMGIGHRVYKVRDPRVAVLEDAIADLVRAGEAKDQLALASAVEKAAVAALERRKPGRGLAANVEFATAVLLDAVGLDRRAFTAAFAAGRVVGWLAHVAEQRREGRLIRPQSNYVGPR
ncbi:MAG: citrate synthase [Alphaproteobacteria bacterium]|nr:citrate synthase [Alphaproteobacteria bacterium]MCB9696043.1 citrate synthase [Alphaproteobacteria bacterium]